MVTLCTYLATTCFHEYAESEPQNLRSLGWAAEKL
jgi:hypothetical protein